MDEIDYSALAEKALAAARVAQSRAEKQKHLDEASNFATEAEFAERKRSDGDSS